MSDLLLREIRARAAKGYVATRTYRRFCAARDDVAALLKLLDSEKKTTDALLSVIVKLTNPQPKQCGEAWHRDSTTGEEYGHCSRDAGHAGNHLTANGTEWKP